MNKDQDILRWFNGEISTAEMKRLYPDEDFSTLEKAGFYSKHIDVPQVDAEKALADFQKRHFRKEETKVIPLNFRSFLKVAAIIVLMLSASYFVFFNNEQSFSTSIAETQTFNLPDDSQVVLNAESTLAYSKKNWKNNRTLDLDGEAYFKVTKGNKFMVMTDAGTVEVLGTQFNVKERPNYFEVQCYEGSVGVKFQGKEAILKPGKTFRVINREVVSMKDFNVDQPSWLSNESSFVNVPLWQVIDELENQYDIKIEYENIDTSVLFSGTFSHKDKNIALQSVTIPLKLSYKIKGDIVQLYNYGTE